MHKYMILRGSTNLIRRIVEDLEKLFYPYINKKTKKQTGLLQLVPREIKTFELAFPAGSKDVIKDDVTKIIDKNCKGLLGGVAVHWGPFKKDKFDKDGNEMV